MFSRRSFNAVLTAFNSVMLFPKNEIETGLPPKLPPLPNTKLSTPKISPTRSCIRLVTSLEVISFGLSSPSNKLIDNEADEDPGPTFLMMFFTNCFSPSLPKYSSDIWSVTSIALCSINEIILSVTFSLVPFGIFKEILT